MAITWDIQINNVNVANKRADVTAVRTDSESSLPPQSWTLTNTPSGTSAERTALLNTIKQKVEERATQDAAIDAVVTDLEQTGISALEAWEATR
jgi:hypothetical protein